MWREEVAQRAVRAHEKLGGHLEGEAVILEHALRVWSAPMDHASSIEEAVVGWGHGFPVTVEPCENVLLAVKARRGIKRGSDSTINNLLGLGTWFPVSVITSGPDEITGVST